MTSKARLFVDVEALKLPSFALDDEHQAFRTDLHSHWRHQLLFASEGTLRLEIADSLWLLPPQRAAWIGANTPHITSATQKVSLRTLYLSPDLPNLPTTDCCVFPISPLAREMILHSMRWDPDHTPNTLSNNFFSLLGQLCTQWVASPSPSRLPRATSPELQRAMDFALANLDQPITLQHAAKAARLTPRTLTRRFSHEVHTTWRSFLQQARQIHAMELLAQPNTTVTEVALDVGFESMGAFSQAFKKHTGQTPSAYKRSSKAG